jgi:hypothetical protein
VGRLCCHLAGRDPIQLAASKLPEPDAIGATGAMGLIERLDQLKSLSLIAESLSSRRVNFGDKEG